MESSTPLSMQGCLHHERNIIDIYLTRTPSDLAKHSSISILGAACVPPHQPSVQGCLGRVDRTASNISTCSTISQASQPVSTTKTTGERRDRKTSDVRTPLSSSQDRRPSDARTPLSTSRDRWPSDVGTPLSLSHAMTSTHSLPQPSRSPDHATRALTSPSKSAPATASTLRSSDSG